MLPNPRSLLVVGALPLLLLVGGVLLLGGSDARVGGVPALYALVFALFPLTSLLMAVSWWCWDRHEDYPDEPVSRVDEEGRPRW